MACSAWAVRAAARIGQRAGYLAAAANLPRPNPFTHRGLPDLAAAWQDGYDQATRPSAEQQQ